MAEKEDLVQHYYSKDLDAGELVIIVPAHHWIAPRKKWTTQQPSSLDEYYPIWAEEFRDGWPARRGAIDTKNRFRIPWGSVGMFLGLKRVRRHPKRLRTRVKGRARVTSRLTPVFYINGSQVILPEGNFIPISKVPDWLIEFLKNSKK